jgi:hypothetical protein
VLKAQFFLYLIKAKYPIPAATSRPRNLPIIPHAINIKKPKPISRRTVALFLGAASFFANAGSCWRRLLLDLLTFRDFPRFILKLKANRQNLLQNSGKHWPSKSERLP